MKLLLINTPNRAIPDNFPPYAPFSLMKYLRNHGITDIEFYNVDHHRPTEEQLVEIIKEKKPDILGISAVVSTCYKFTKDISLLVKEVLPNTIILIGGNLAASAEILLKKTGADFCVIGEGEKILLNFMKRFETAGDNPEEYEDIPGLAYLGQDGGLINTGYEDPLSSDEIYEIDYEDFEDTIDFYFPKVFNENDRVTLRGFEHDQRTYEPHRHEKRYMQFIVGKGCVAKCTFCHRWDKGIRHIPVSLLMERLDYVIEKYDVGFINPQIEAFGCDKKWLFDFCDELKKRDILWTAGAVRAKTMSRELIDKMDDSGCTSIVYGLETGSPKMLKVMEKKTTLEENIRAQKLTIDKGYYSTVVQFVIGMPGESVATINESSKFAQECMTMSKWTNPHNISINFAQALPGTPLYEFGRRQGLIGVTLNDEEQYLLDVSDRDASEPVTAINFNEYPTIVFWSWKYKIYIETVYAYIKKYGMDQYFSVINTDSKYTLFELLTIDKIEEEVVRPSFLKLVVARRMDQLILYYPKLLYQIRFLFPLLMLVLRVKILGIAKSKDLFVEYIKYLIIGKFDNKNIMEGKSLRKTVYNDMEPMQSDIESMLPLRKGR